MEGGLHVFVQSSNIPRMIPNHRAARLVVELAPELRAAVEAEAERQTEDSHRKVSMSDVIRDLVVEHLYSKNLGVSA